MTQMQKEMVKDYEYYTTRENTMENVSRLMNAGEVLKNIGYCSDYIICCDRIDETPSLARLYVKKDHNLSLYEFLNR